MGHYQNNKPTPKKKNKKLGFQSWPGDAGGESERASCDFASLELKWISASIANSIM